MKITKDEIVNLADQLIRERGYNGFSYADLSAPLKIKNASIHYYFPTKSDLGVEVIKQATKKFISEIANWRVLTYREQLSKFVLSYTQKQQNHCVCLVGALAPVYDTLSPGMQQELKNIVALLMGKLTEILAIGREVGEFDFSESPEAKAAIVQSSLISSLLLDRVLQNDVFQIIENEILSI